MKNVLDVMDMWNGEDMRYIIVVEKYKVMYTIWNGTLDGWYDDDRPYEDCRVKDYNYDAGTVFIQITEITRG